MPRWKRARISSLTFSRPSRRRCRDDLPPRNQTASAASATVRISGDRHPGWRGGTHRVREAGGGPGRRSHGFHRLGGGRRRQRPASAALLQGRLRRPQPLMRTVDHVRVLAPFPRVFAAASTVARWPSILPHYRWVRVLDDGLVEMAAWRPFGGGLLKARTSAVRTLTRFDPAPFRSHMAAEIPDFRPQDHLDAKRAKRLDRFSQLAVTSAGLALADAQITPRQEDPDRVGTMMGSALGGVSFAESQVPRYLADGPRGLDPSMALAG